jgi:Fe-S-cluster containining protein
VDGFSFWIIGLKGTFSSGLAFSKKMNNAVLPKLGQADPAQAAWLDRMAALFEAMDKAYEDAASHYGFVCSGCEESCCLTRFYHHTCLEYAFLKKGFERLDAQVQEVVKGKAAACCSAHRSADAAGQKIRIMCPLNADGRCRVYRFRPMICRLHGVPHELHVPGRDTQYGSGCDCFAKQSDGKAYYPFDRTPFYKTLAELERGFRGMLGADGKIRMTIAEMVLTF